MKNITIYFVIIVLYISLGLIYHEQLQKRTEKDVADDLEPLPIQEHIHDRKAPQNEKYKLLGVYTVTAYCPCVKCCGKTNGVTASGAVATEGRTIAADMPFGTKVTIEGIGERIVEDRGGAIKGDKIDVFMNSHSEALKFGVRKLKVWEVER